MVRTSAAGIKISSGKSTKKGGGGSHSGGGSNSSSIPSRKSSNQGSSRLPSIPHTDTPSWQKPITNFFSSGTGSLKDKNDIESGGSSNNKKKSSSNSEETDKENYPVVDKVEETDSYESANEKGSHDKTNDEMNCSVEGVEQAQSKARDKSEDEPDPKKLKDGKDEN